MVESDSSGARVSACDEVVSIVNQLISQLRQSVLTIVERSRVFACRAVLDRGPPSPTVDYHALCVLLKHLSSRDIDFLRRSLGSPKIDLDDIRPLPEASFFARMLWVLALDGYWPGPTLRRVEYFTGDRSFAMELDLAYAPECTYFAEDPTPSLTRLLRLGGDVFYDIGANVGFHSLTGGLFFRESHAFEPTPQTVLRLSRNVDLNRDGHVTVHGVGISSYDGEARLLLDRVHPGGNSLISTSPSPDKEVVNVPVYRLDTFRKIHNLPAPSVIKIDVEGHEYDVLTGAEETVDAGRPTIFVEVHSREILERFARRLPPSYDAYVLPTSGAPIPISVRDPIGPDHDFLFVDGSKRAELEERLRGVQTGSHRK